MFHHHFSNQSIGIKNSSKRRATHTHTHTHIKKKVFPSHFFVVLSKLKGTSWWCCCLPTQSSEQTSESVNHGGGEGWWAREPSGPFWTLKTRNNCIETDEKRITKKKRQSSLLKWLETRRTNKSSCGIQRRRHTQVWSWQQTTLREKKKWPLNKLTTHAPHTRPRKPLPCYCTSRLLYTLSVCVCVLC